MTETRLNICVYYIRTDSQDSYSEFLLHDSAPKTISVTAGNTFGTAILDPWSRITLL